MVGCRGVGGGVGRTARTAATFWAFLTLVTATFLACRAGALRAAVFGVAFLALVAFAGAAFLTAAFSFVGFRVGDLAALARFALGFAAALAFTGRFAALAVARLLAERAVDRRRPFVRLLLMC